MMWMGKVSAMAAIAAGVLLAALAILSWDGSSVIMPAINAASAGLLLAAAVRTLRKQSGGLRLLCGAWGLTAGLSVERLLGFDAIHFWSLLVAGLAAVSIGGLALTVLHKEK